VPIIFFYYYTCIYNTCKFSNDTESKALISPDFGADFGTECTEDRSLYVRLSVMFVYSVETSKRIS